MIKLCTHAFICLAVLTPSICFAQSKERVMVLSVEGSSVPSMQEYQQFELPFSLDLLADGRIELAVFSRCERLLVEGPGRIGIDKEVIFTGGGHIEREKGHCAQAVKYGSEDSVAGGITLRLLKADRGHRPHRSGRLKTPLVARPSIIVEDRFSLLGRQLVFTAQPPAIGRFAVPLDAPFLVWPEAGPALEVGQAYSIEIIGADSEPKGNEIVMTVSESSPETAQYLVLQPDLGK